jgi:hypothetical protein
LAFERIAGQIVTLEIDGATVEEKSVYVVLAFNGGGLQLPEVLSMPVADHSSGVVL